MSSSILPALPTKFNDSKNKIEPLDEVFVEVDAQRIMSLLNEVEKKLTLIDILPESSDKKVNNVFTIDTMYLITEFRATEKKLGEQIKDRRNQEEIIRTRLDIEKVTRNLYRHFSTNPLIFNKLHNLSNKYEQNDFIRKVIDFKGIIDGKLRCSAEQESSEKSALESIVSTETKMREEIGSLQLKLQLLQSSREESVKAKNSVIDALKDELRGIRKHAEDANRKLDTKAKAKEITDYSEFEERKSKLVAEINAVKAKHQGQILVNRDEESNLERKKSKVEAEVENWLAKYDQDMGEKQAEIDEFVSMYADKEVQFDELKSQYSKSKKVYDEIQSELDAIKALAKLEADFIEKQRVAATKIQAAMRGYLERKRIAQVKSKPQKGKRSASKRLSAKKSSSKVSSAKKSSSKISSAKKSSSKKTSAK